MWSRSASSSVTAIWDSGSAAAAAAAFRLGGRRTLSELRITLRSIKFWSWRMFPGHEYEISSDIASEEMWSICLPIRWA